MVFTVYQLCFVHALCSKYIKEQSQNQRRRESETAVQRHGGAMRRPQGLCPGHSTPLSVQPHIAYQLRDRQTAGGE